jgi:hypothetical protein
MMYPPFHAPKVSLKNREPMLGAARYGRGGPLDPKTQRLGGTNFEEALQLRRLGCCFGLRLALDPLGPPPAHQSARRTTEAGS